MRPWGVHVISDIYRAGCQSGLPDGTWVAAVAEPYTANRLVAAWWVLTGRAYALKWPKPADLERTLGLPPKKRIYVAKAYEPPPQELIHPQEVIDMQYFSSDPKQLKNLYKGIANTQ